MYYVVGLGNPGDSYSGTRHNVGRDALLAVAKGAGFSDWSHSKGANAVYARGNLETMLVEFLLPETYMNNSGDSVRYLKNKHDVTPEELIVVYDDIDLPVGEIKVSVDKGDGGHNGVKSVIAAMGSKEFARVRIGIAGRSFWSGDVKRPKGGRALTSRVLGRFSKRERDQIEETYPRVAAILATIMREGAQAAMNTYN